MKKRVQGYTRVVWTAGECRAVGEEFTAVSRRYPQMSARDLIDLAQSKVLPRDRHRSLHTYQKMIKAAMEHTAKPVASPPAPPTVLPESAVATPVAPPPVAEQFALREEAIVAAFEAAASAFASVFAARLAADVANQLGMVLGRAVEQEMTKVTDGMNDVLLAMQEHAPQNITIKAVEPPPDGITHIAIAPRDRKPRVAVMGLIAQQEQDVLRDFGDVMEFTFIRSKSSGGGSGQDAEKMKHCDVIVSMTRFVGHWNENMARAAGAPLMRINGSVSMLKRWLQKYFNGEVALAQGETEINNEDD